MNARYDEIQKILPTHFNEMLEKMVQTIGDNILEIRVRCGKPLIVETSKGSFVITPDGSPSPATGGAYIVSERDLKLIFQAACENSVYAFMDEIKQGFITVKGGHRIGFSGRAVLNDDKIENFREISSLNIRVAREVVGAANYIIGDVLKPFGVVSTLVVSPPMGGKTTVLRDLTRQISDKGIKTALIDERGEMASLSRGVPQCDVGVQTDVIENAPKADAVVMMLRTMSPQLIVTDEIATAKDAGALMQAFGTGVSVIASTHGASVDDVMQREGIKSLFGGIGFKQIIVLQKEGMGVNTKVYGKTFGLDDVC